MPLHESASQHTAFNANIVAAPLIIRKLARWFDKICEYSDTLPTYLALRTASVLR